MLCFNEAFRSSRKDNLLSYCRTYMCFQFDISKQAPPQTICFQHIIYEKNPFSCHCFFKTTFQFIFMFEFNQMDWQSTWVTSLPSNIFVRFRKIPCKMNRIGVVKVGVLASNAVDRGFEPRSGQIKDYKIGICCFSAKHAALRRKSKDWLARNQDNVSE